MPWREMEWHAAVEVFVAQHPADAARPRQHAKGGRVGNDSEIGRARHLVETHPAAARERGEGAGIGGIEGSSGDVDVVAGLERGTEHRNRHRFGAARAKAVNGPVFRAALEAGYNINVATTTLDSANARTFASFTRGGGMGLDEMTGSPNLTIVPDPSTFRVLPWASGV